MATDTGGFQSKFRRERQQGAGGAAARGRRVFEASGEERTSISTTTGTAGRYRSTGDRGDKSESVTSRMNKLNMNDDKNDSDKEDKPDRNEDDDEEETAKKSHKKDRGGASANSARKRQARKNLREKRRSTGVVIMPGQPTAPADDEEKAVQENTAKNMDAGAQNRTSPSSETSEDVRKQLEAYEIAIEEWKDELAKAKKEIEALQKDNQRLKDENSALLRVVGSLSGPRK